MDRCIAPVEEHHLSSLNAPHSEPEQHAAKHSLHNTCCSTTCQEGDAPASIVVSSQVNGCTYCVNCLKDQQEAPIRESMPLLDPDVRMKCSHGTGIYIYMYIYMYVHLHVCTFTCIYIYMYIYMYIC